MRFPLKLEGILMLKPNRPIFKNYAKTANFLHVLNTCVRRQRTETCRKPMQKSIKNHSPSRLCFVEILIVFGIDVRTRNFEVLERIWASISASIWGQVDRLGASWGRLVACLRDDLDVLVTQGLASWQNVMDLTRNSRGTHAQLTRNSQQHGQGQRPRLSIYEAIGLDLLYLLTFCSVA